MRHPALDDLLAEPLLDAQRPDHLVYRGQRAGFDVEVALASDGVATLRVTARRPQRLRFVTCAQCPTPHFVTGDPAFDAALAVLGDEEGLLTLNGQSRRRVQAWMAQPRRWCTDVAVGAAGVPADALESHLTSAVAILDGLRVPPLAELIADRAHRSAGLQARIDARVEAEIADAPHLDAILDAMATVPAAVRLSWLERAAARLGHYPAQTLELLPDPAPAAFDGLILRWTQADATFGARLTAILADPVRLQALLRGAMEEPGALATVAAHLPMDAWSAARFEALSPKSPEARIARLDALAERPAGDPEAYRVDLRHLDAGVRDRALAVISVHLPRWLEDPTRGPVALQALGLAERHGDRFIELVLQSRHPRLVAALASQRFDSAALEKRRLEALCALPGVPPMDLTRAITSTDRAQRQAAEALVGRYLEPWLRHPNGGAMLQGVIAARADLGAEVLALCGANAYPGAVPALTAIKAGSESERVAVVMALGRTGSPKAERVLLGWMDRGYRLRLACVEALGQVGGKASLKALNEVANGFFVERTLKETATRAVSLIEARLGGGTGALSLTSADGRLSLPEDD